ncbi:MAG TPA: O-methyltransferase [Kofleriaceae bacterium]|nr:O-methyltransferase [Kofleriaceae bacterium]
MADTDSRKGLRYSSEEVVAWVDRVHAGHDPALDAAFQAPARHDMPAIMVGASEGKLLELLVRLVGARKIVEVGTLAGYSAIRLARGMGAGGKLWTIEYDPRHAEVAREAIATAGVADRVEVLVGAGVDVLPTLDRHGPFDLVFLDADKQSYDKYAEWALVHLRPGGLIVGDNAYFFGKLMEDSDGGRAMRRFHERVAAGCDSVCVPTPDGLVVGIRR